MFLLWLMPNAMFSTGAEFVYGKDELLNLTIVFHCKHLLNSDAIGY